VYFIFMCKLYKPCPKDAVCQISEYLDRQFMRRRFFNIQQILHFFGPVWAPIGASPLILQTLIPIPQRSFLPNLAEISSVVLEKKSFKGKVYAGRRTTDDRRRTGGDHYSSLEPSAQLKILFELFTRTILTQIL